MDIHQEWNDKERDMALVDMEAKLAASEAARLKEAAVVAVMRRELEWMLSPESDWKNGQAGVGYVFRDHARAALSATDAGKPFLEVVEAAKRLRFICDARMGPIEPRCCCDECRIRRYFDLAIKEIER